MKMNIFVPIPYTMIYIRFWASMWTYYFNYDIFAEHHEILICGIIFQKEH